MPKTDRIDRLLEQWAIERPDLDASSMGVIGRLMILNRFAEQAMEQTLSEYKITLPEFDVLAVLRRCGPPFKKSIGVLCSYSLLSSGAMTNRVDRLEKKKLVRREQNPQDRRGVVVALTEEGKQLIDVLIEERLNEADKFTSAISLSEKEQLEATLKKLLLSLDKEEF